MTDHYAGSHPSTDPPPMTSDTTQVSESRSIGEIMGDVSKDVTTLLRQEVDLTKAELKQSTSRAGKGAGLLVGAAVAGLLFLVFLSVSAWWGLGLNVGNEWAGLIVAVIWAVVAAVLALVGKKELDTMKGLPQTADTVTKIPNALKGHEENNR